MKFFCSHLRDNKSDKKGTLKNEFSVKYGRNKKVCPHTHTHTH